jgi:Domain of unknown function (DUF4157)
MERTRQPRSSRGAAAPAEPAESGRTGAMRVERSAQAASIARRDRIYRKASGQAGDGGARASIPEGGGTALPAPVKRAMEPALGADLSGVRIHTGGSSAQAASSLGARAFTVGSDVHFGAGQFAPGTREGDRLIAHELTHTVQNDGGVKRKADGKDDKKGVSQPGEPAEKEADTVADRVADQLHGGPEAAPAKVTAQAAPISRKEEEPQKKEEAKPDPLLDEILAQLKPFGITFESPLGQVALLLVKTARNAPVTPEEKDKATSAVTALDPAAFSTLMTILQSFGLLEAFMKAVGPENAKKTSEQMAVEVPVPAVVFGRVNKGDVEKHYATANEVFKPHNLKITLSAFTDADQAMRKEGYSKKLLGNSGGEIDAGELKTDDKGQYSELVGRIIARFQQPGTVTSYWFASMVGEKGDLDGRAVREAEDARFKGREAVFVDAQAADNVLAHELGHILGGKGEESKHVKGADGKEESGDKNNLMFGKPEGGKELTPEQAQAFKTSIYGQISKANVKAGEKKEEKKG